MNKQTKLSPDQKPVSRFTIITTLSFFLVFGVIHIYILLVVLNFLPRPPRLSQATPAPVGKVITTATQSIEVSTGSTRTQPAQEPEAVPRGAVEVSTISQSTDEGQAIFNNKCVACHKIGGGDFIGPDLEGVTDRRDRKWLMGWIAEPDKMLASGDPIGTQLLEEYNNVPMPNLALTESEVSAVLSYLENPGVTSASQTDLPSGKPYKGKDLFTGAVRLQNGAPACISCHNVAEIGALGGGTLGPDQTNVYTRYGDSGLAAVLKGLPFPSMQAVYGDKPLTEDEVANLFAFFIQVDQTTAQPVNYNFVWIGVIGLLILVILGQLIWRKRLIAVRKPLLGGAK